MFAYIFIQIIIAKHDKPKIIIVSLDNLVIYGYAINIGAEACRFGILILKMENRTRHTKRNTACGYSLKFFICVQKLLHLLLLQYKIPVRLDLPQGLLLYCLVLYFYF